MSNSKSRSPKPGKQKIWILVAVLVALGILLAFMIGNLPQGGNDPDSSFHSPDGTTPPGQEQNGGDPENATNPGEASSPDNPDKPNQDSTKGSEQENDDPTQPPTEPGPYSMEDGKLEIESVFQFTGMNPDFGWAEGKNIGAIILHNRSDEYLKDLKITVAMTDGASLEFLVQELPAGQTVWAFELNNTSYTANARIENVQCEALFLKSAGLGTDQVETQIDGMNVRLTNVSGKELNGLQLWCHNMFNGVYFGGMAYAYPVDNLAAGASATVTAMDCFLGETGLVRIDFEN